jgi:hypothetical protein
MLRDEYSFKGLRNKNQCRVLFVHALILYGSLKDFLRLVDGKSKSKFLLAYGIGTYLISGMLSVTLLPY